MMSKVAKMNKAALLWNISHAAKEIRTITPNKIIAINSFVPISITSSLSFMLLPPLFKLFDILTVESEVKNMHLNPEEIDKLISKETNDIWNTGGFEFLINALLNEFATANVELSDEQTRLLVRSTELIAKSITKNTIGATLNALGQMNNSDKED